jgi:hypothetical protein
MSFKSIEFFLKLTGSGRLFFGNWYAFIWVNFLERIFFLNFTKHLLSHERCKVAVLVALGFGSQICITGVLLRLSLRVDDFYFCGCQKNHFLDFIEIEGDYFFMNIIMLYFYALR